MAGKITKTPKSPRYSLPWAIDKMMILLEKEGLHPVAPDIMAQHLGYSNARNGQAATVLGTLRMYGMILKAPHRKDLISEDIKKFKYTPYDEEKHQLADKWLKSPKLFASVLTKYPDNLPSDPALRYELIQEFNFTEEAANKFIKVLKESIEYTQSFAASAQSREVDDLDDFEEVEDEGEIEETPKPANTASGSPTIAPISLSEDSFSVQITGPGINSVIEIKEEEDLMIVEAMLKKVGKKVFAE